MPTYLSPADVCALIPGMTVATLKMMRHRGDGPRFIKPSPRKVVYAADDIERFMESRVASSTRDCI